MIDESRGERWFCTVEEAELAGWRAPKVRPAADTPTPTATATATQVPPSPTATPTAIQAPPSPTATPNGEPDVRISCIFFDGKVYRTEADEYVEVVNLGHVAQDLAGWELMDTGDEPMDGKGMPVFQFPQWLLGPGGVIRVYTNEIHDEWGGFSFGSGLAVWNNADPDTAELYNEAGELVSTMSYPPGC